MFLLIYVGKMENGEPWKWKWWQDKFSSFEPISVVNDWKYQLSTVSIILIAFFTLYNITFALDIYFFQGKKWILFAKRALSDWPNLTLLKSWISWMNHFVNWPRISKSRRANRNEPQNFESPSFRRWDVSVENVKVKTVFVLKVSVGKFLNN